MKMNVIVFGVLLVCFTLVSGQGGPLCLKCDNVAGPSQCTNQVTCAADEQCYSEKKLENLLTTKYSYGCQKKSVCKVIASGTIGTIIGRKRNTRTAPGEKFRRDATICSRCCPGDLCSAEICSEQEVLTTGIPAQLDVMVRLFGGSNAYEGTVEVYYNNLWGSICDDNWSGEDAGVICTMLGYSSVGAGAVGLDRFTASRGRIWLEDVNCTGSEKTIADCPKGPWGVTDCSHMEDAGVLCQSVSKEDDIIFVVDTGRGGVLSRMNLFTGSYVDIPTEYQYTVASFDYDSKEGRIYFEDPKLKQIVSVHFDGTDNREVRQLPLNADLEKVEVDPINRRLFYTDTGNDVIGSMNLDGSDFKIVISGNLDEPREILVHPQTKNIFWSDWGKSPKIERASYDGSGRTTLANTGLMWPNGMALDYNENKLYFVDGGTHQIEVMELDGTNRRVIFRDTGAHLFAVDVYKNYLYYTDWNQMTIMRINKDGSHKTAVGPPAFRELADIRIHEYGADIQGPTSSTPVHFDPSHIFIRMVGTASYGRVDVYANGEWGSICDDHWDSKDASVICGMLGYNRENALARTSTPVNSGSGLIFLDEVNCTGTETHIVQCGFSEKNWAQHDCSHNEDAGVTCEVPQNPNNFLLFTDVSSGHLFRMDLTTFSFTAIPQPSSPNPVALTYDSVTKQIFYSEVVPNPGSQIRGLGIDGHNITVVKQLQLGSVPDGLAVDSRAGKLFYTDTGSDVIESMNLDGSQTRIIAKDSLDQPRAVVVDTINQVVFWTDWGSTPKIERANYDGSSRKTIVSTNIKLPNGLAIDESAGLLYFCDAGTHQIEVVDLDGNNRKVLYQDFGAHFFGITITDKYIFYSDWNKSGVMKINKDGSGNSMAGPPGFSRINALVAYSN